MSLDAFGRAVRLRVLKETHLTVGVGIAQTKTTAKLANHAAKSGARRAACWISLTSIVSEN